MIAENSAKKIMVCLEGAGFATRFVGGYVRDTCLGVAVHDIDLATTATPNQMITTLDAAGIKTVPTGIDHGTVTAIVDHKGFEITTLREDVQTDGRHAVVAFTDDWQKDAARRDFTMNAMSRDGQGVVHDYFGGRADLAAGVIRFVGEAKDRIKEDYLRVLRFFRFQAWYGKILPDAALMALLEEAAPELKTLSRERVWKELSKLLAAPDPSEAVMLMLQTGVLKEILPEADRLATLCSLVSYERMRRQNPAQLTPKDLEDGYKAPVASFKANPLLRLAALLTGKKMEAEKLQKQFALSKTETQNLTHYLNNPLVFEGQFSAQNLSFCLYRYGFDSTQEFMVLAQAQAAQFHWESAQSMLEKMQPKPFPLKGGDIAALGVPAGPQMGEILKAVEHWWIAQEFIPDRAECLAKAKDLIKSE